MGNTFASSDARNQFSTSLTAKSLTVRGCASKLASIEGEIECDEIILVSLFYFILFYSNIININYPWGPSKHMSKADTSVKILKNSNNSR